MAKSTVENLMDVKDSVLLLQKMAFRAVHKINDGSLVSARMVDFSKEILFDIQNILTNTIEHLNS